MFTDFEQSDFLEFFDQESLSYLDESRHIEIYNYSVALEHNLILSLFMCPLEQTLSLTLRHSDITTPIFDLGFNNHDIDKVTLTKESHVTLLNIYKTPKDTFLYQDKKTLLPDMKIMIKPSVAIHLDF